MAPLTRAYVGVVSLARRPPLAAMFMVAFVLTSRQASIGRGIVPICMVADSFAAVTALLASLAVVTAALASSVAPTVPAPSVPAPGLGMWSTLMVAVLPDPTVSRAMPKKYPAAFFDSLGVSAST